MNDRPSISWFWYMIGIWALMGVALVMLGTGMARAQQNAEPICAPMSQLAPAWEEHHKERIIWEGVVPTPQGPVEMVLFQSDKGAWSMFVVQGGVGCLRAAGTDGTPINGGV